MSPCGKKKKIENESNIAASRWQLPVSFTMLTGFCTYRKEERQIMEEKTKYAAINAYI